MTNKTSDAINAVSQGGLRLKGIKKTSTPDEPLVTIITVVFNGEEFLEKTIKSVLGQKYKNIEYVVVDGGSTDKTLEIIKKYEGEIDCWISEKDGGIYDAMNKGIDLATGDWINFLNADDTFDGEITLIAHHFKQDYSLIYGTVNVLNTSRDQKFFISNPNVQKQDFYTSTPICHQAIFYSKAYIRKYDTSYKILADRVMTYEVVEANENIKFDPSFSVSYYENGMSMAFKNRIRATLEEIRFLKKIEKLTAGVLLTQLFKILVLLPVFTIIRKTPILKLYRKVKYNHL